MAVIKGQTGTVSLATSGTVNIANITSWSLSQEADTIETAVMGATNHKGYQGGMTSWSGSIECLLDTVDSQHDDIVVGNDYELTLFSGTGGKTYTGAVVVTSMSSGGSVSDVVSVSFDFQGRAALGIA